MGPDMAVDSVFSQLQQLFPQIDNRALKAVAIEHKKDVDAAALAVLNEIIPYLSDRSAPASPLARSVSNDGSSHASVAAVAVSQTEDDPSESRVGSDEVQDSYNVSSGIDLPNDLYSGSSDEPKTEGAISVDKCPESSSKENSHSTPWYMVGAPKIVVQNANLNKEGRDIAAQTDVGNEESVPKKSCADCDNPVMSANSCSHDEPKTEEAISVGKSPESSSKELSYRTPWYMLGSAQNVQMGVDQVANLIDEVGDIAAETVVGNEEGDDLEKSCENGDNPVIEATASLSLDDVAAVGSQLEATEKLEETTTESQSSQILALDDIIADATNNMVSDTYFAEVESITILMRKVELKKQEAVKAKEEAAKGGNPILDRVEELTQMLLRAQEANDMHSGEVFGEKAILATELKELQSRVLSISDERDKSLAVLAEMRQSLELQLAAAEDEIRLAEEEKLEKERLAQKSLAEQELIMEKVVQESKMLKQQAEDNAKLQEFLLDRGGVVDMLQGEIAFMCQDVKLLKEKFDANVPFSQSMSSLETSLVLASSKSSLAMEIDNFPQTQQKSDNEQVHQEDEATSNNRRLLVEDGWELCDDDEIDA